MALADVKSKLARYGFGLLAMLVPAAMQLALFAFYARALGAEQYGLYIGLMSWSPICFELVGWGAGEYLIKRTAQSPTNFAAARMHLRLMFWVTLPVGGLVFGLLTASVIGHAVSVWTIAMIGLAEFAGMRLMVNAEQMAIGLGRFRSANWLRILQVFPRITAVAIAYFGLGLHSFDKLALAGSLGILLFGSVAAWCAQKSLPVATGAQISSEGLRQGTWFTGNQLVRAGQHNVDRIVLTTLVDPSTLALYSAAQRFIQLGLLPLQSVLRMTYRGFFETGKSGIGASLRYGLSVLPIALGAAVIAAVCLFASASLLPILIGPEFAQSVSYLLYLTPILLLFAINSTFSDTLSGAGYLFLRVALTTAGIAVQGSMFLLFHDGMQLIFASYAGIGLSCLLTVSATFFHTSRKPRLSMVTGGSA